MIETFNPFLGATGILAVGIEGFLIFLVIAGISAAAEWLKKKRQREQDSSPSETEWSPPPPRPTERSSSATGDDGKPLSQWEEEIRRMLNGLDPQAPAPPPLPPPPPPIVRQAPPPVYQTRPVVVAVEEGESEEPVPTYLSSIERADSAYRRAGVLGQGVDGRMATAAALGNAADAWNRAGSIDERVRARLSEASNFLQHAPAGKVNKSRSAEAEQLVAAFRNPATVRQAFVASFVLGPPKALEN